MEQVKLFLKSEKMLYFVLLLFALFCACLANSYDYDLYARLIVGEYFFNVGNVAFKDFLSYTPTHAWYDHEWGASVIIYAFFKLFGNFGLVLVQALTIFVTTFFVLKTQTVQEKKYPVLLAFVMIFMLLFSYLNLNIVRCHMFSFMFFSMLLYVLERTRLSKSNMIFFMPIVFFFWNNIHGGVVSGLGLVFIYYICALFNRKTSWKYLLTLLISLFLLVINPYGVDYLNFLFSANTMNRSYIAEWRTVFANHHVEYYYSFFVIGFFVFINFVLNLIKKKELPLTKLAVLTVTLSLAILHVKLFPLMLITVASLFSREICILFDKKFLRFFNKLALIAMLIAISIIPLMQPGLAKTDVEKFPVLEVEFLKQNNIRGNTLITFGLGSYLSYKLYPYNLIYMDGRYEEVYNTEEFENMANYEKAIEDSWDVVLKKYPTQILMPLIISPVYEKLKSNPYWKEVYTGKLCGIFLPMNVVNYKTKFILPVDDLNYYQVREFDKICEFGK